MANDVFGPTPSGDIDKARNVDKSDIDLLSGDEALEIVEKNDKPRGPKDTTKEVEEDNADEVDLQELENEDETEDDEENKTEEEEEVEEVESDTGVRPSFKTMVKEFPELDKIIKKYPQIRDAYYSEGKYRQLFPELSDASEASQKAESLDVFNDLLLNGSSKELFEAIGSDNKDALKKLATGILPTLHKIDSELFTECVTPVINTVIRNLYKSGEQSKDNNMMAAARILSKYLYNSPDIPSASSKQVDPEIENERKALDAERRSIQEERYKEFDSDVQSRTKRLLIKVIDDGLDKNGDLSPFIKSKIIEDVIDRVGTQLASDASHKSVMNKLIKAALNSRLSKESADRIITAYLSRAKQLIPEIRAKVRAEAFGSRSKSNTNGNRTRRDPGTSSTIHSSRRTIETDPKKIDWRKVSDKDILG